MAPRIVLVMGVSGSGKTTVGRALAAALGAQYLDADDYHSQANIERMHHGIPLDDAARQPWLHRVRHAVLEGARNGQGVVFACSALKASYRHTLLDGVPDAVTVHLDVDRVTLDRRLRERHGHFMPASLLDSQLADLEFPRDAIVVDGALPTSEIVRRILAALGDRAEMMGQRTD